MNDAIPVLVVDDDMSIQGIVEETLIEDGFIPRLFLRVKKQLDYLLRTSIA